MPCAWLMQSQFCCTHLVLFFFGVWWAEEPSLRCIDYGQNCKWKIKTSIQFNAKCAYTKVVGCSECIALMSACLMRCRCYGNLSFYHYHHGQPYIVWSPHKQQVQGYLSHKWFHDDVFAKKQLWKRLWCTLCVCHLYPVLIWKSNISKPQDYSTHILEFYLLFKAQFLVF